MQIALHRPELLSELRERGICIELCPSTYVQTGTFADLGPVREVTHTPSSGLVFEVAFEGLQRSTRHKSGLAMRFPRISRIRWDKPPGEADRIETLEALLPG